MNATPASPVSPRSRHRSGDPHGPPLTVFTTPQARYHPCPGGRHWGPRGAAGILPWAVTPDGRAWVLLSHRSPHVQAGGTWSTFGGAIDAGETPWHAAIRETGEEIEGIDVRPDAATPGHQAACRHGCGWSYTTFAVRVRDPGTDDLPQARVTRGHAAWETAGLAWVPADEVAAHPGLHPGLRAAWPALHRLIRDRLIRERAC